MRPLDPTRPLRFAIIGCGSVASAQHIPNIAASRRMQLHTCLDLDDAVLAECRERFGALHTGKDWAAAVADPKSTSSASPQPRSCACLLSKRRPFSASPSMWRSPSPPRSKKCAASSRSDTKRRSLSASATTAALAPPCSPLISSSASTWRTPNLPVALAARSGPAALRRRRCASRFRAHQRRLA